MLWNLIQHMQINHESDVRELATRELSRRTHSLDDRVQQLEAELARTREQLQCLTVLLEKRFGEDLNDDGTVER